MKTILATVASLVVASSAFAAMPATPLAKQPVAKGKPALEFAAGSKRDTTKSTRGTSNTRPNGKTFSG